MVRIGPKRLERILDDMEVERQYQQQCIDAKPMPPIVGVTDDHPLLLQFAQGVIDGTLTYMHTRYQK
ncbi:MAG: hypothetical protein ABII01_04410 [Candidatus Woesearchaeota archaeon]